MTLERREQLIEEIVDTQPRLKVFVRPQPHDLSSGSWDLLAYSFQRGFEALWDSARLDRSGLLLRPLLVLWRQSVELTIKAATIDVSGEITIKPGHDLSKLFERLLAARAALGHRDADDYTSQVGDMVAEVQALDPFADRFRYPASKSGTIVSQSVV